ncbi:unnamed protein product [Malus baccata var. baccata]
MEISNVKVLQLLLFILLNLYVLRLVFQVANGAGTNDGKTIQVIFNFVFLESVEKLLPWMQENFPELSLDKTKFNEMSWIESVLYISGIPRNESETLLHRAQQSKGFFKAKSDYVTEPISEAGLEGLWERLLQLEIFQLILTPFGGIMSEVSDSEIPFPHRKGTLFEIQYLVSWGDDKETEKHIGSMKMLYEYMTPYVSKSPRAAYLNYRDLDLGTNKNGNTSYAQASIWGLRYFKNNFRRLVHVKTLVDPENFFRNEQSIPDGTNGGKVITVLFDCLFLETVEKLLPWMQENFPELSLDQTKFTEMSWIDSVLYFSGIPRNESELLLQRRTEDSNRFFKAKSDYVTDPISEAGLEHLWKILLEEERSVLILTPFGGKMSEISDSETPFPHRKGTLFEIQYMIFWNDDKETEKHIGWMRRLYEYMTPHVSKSPRAAYLNYRDLDLGRNIDDGSTGYEEASIWGLKYFKGNFMRLVNVKTVVDPDNFFWDEQTTERFLQCFASHYEGLSYVLEAHFIIIDLLNLWSIDVDIENESGWVESGATLSECTTQFHRRVKFMDFQQGHVQLSGEELFWAIRGGGGSSFGVILAWKLRLVPVPPSVTGFKISQTIEQGATKLFLKWQYIADTLHEDIFLHSVIGVGNKVAQMTAATALSWVEYVLYFAGISTNESEALLRRTQQSKSFFKAKSDYVSGPIWNLAWKSPRGAYLNYRVLDLGLGRTMLVIQAMDKQAFGV